MYKSTQAFIKKLDERKLHYKDCGTAESGDDVLTVSWNLNKTASSVSVSVFFDDDSRHVALRCFNYVKFTEDKTAAVLAVINEQNKRFRWAKFVLDPNDHTVQVEADAIFRDHDVGDICHELMLRIVDICETAYPEFMKAIWN